MIAVLMMRYVLTFRVEYSTIDSGCGFIFCCSHSLQKQGKINRLTGLEAWLNLERKLGSALMISILHEEVCMAAYVCNMQISSLQWQHA